MSNLSIKYELVLLIRQDVSTAHVNDLQETFKEVIAKNQGHVRYAEYCGLLSLAYPIQRNKKAHFLLFHFEAPGGSLADLEHKARLSPDVLRFLKIKVDDFGRTPSVLAQSHLQREQFGKVQTRGGTRTGVKRDVALTAPTMTKAAPAENKAADVSQDVVAKQGES